ncbi:death-associated inhibitor of apoptosis 1-like isoform X1 [Haliotis rufescens]|uniref:death-associated inhibitor of apoptosis 1-like isoform X1 n=2 Tax=Haliotis rufescens TaxID=6454 RepID=UPI00201EFBC6|nr:death-associated inhibitor of apoptosis 1-like isoform X1 [Haliotis rufescens]
MAKAGFFYSGLGNTLLCAHCGNILHSWVVGDCPWKRHAELNSKCPFLARGCSLGKAGLNKQGRMVFSVPPRDHCPAFVPSGAYPSRAMTRKLKKETLSLKHKYNTDNAKDISYNCSFVPNIPAKIDISYLVHCMEKKGDKLDACHVENTCSTVVHSTAKPSFSITKNAYLYRGNDVLVKYMRSLSQDREEVKPTESTEIERILKGIVKNSSDHSSRNNFMNNIIVSPFLSLQTYFEGIVRGEALQDDDMRYEALRLKSFQGISVSVSCLRLASSGFFATGLGDEARCFSCDMRYKHWLATDDPRHIHRRISPACRHINGSDSRSVPISITAGSDRVSISASVATATPGGDQTLNNHQDLNTENIGTSSTEHASQEENGVYDQVRAAGIQQVNCSSREADIIPSSQHIFCPEQCAPSQLTEVEVASGNAGPASSTLTFATAVYPHYDDRVKRLSTFKTWPSNHCKKPEVLVQVGFFFAGYSDCVRCFVCGVGLKTWEEGDDPWVEHVRWRSSCAYILAFRGEQFVLQTLGSLGQKTNTTDIISMDVCQRALGMGYSEDTVTRAFHQVKATHEGGRFPDLAALLEVLLKQQSESEGLTVDADASARGTRYAEANSGGSRTANSSSEESKSSASWNRQTDRIRCYGETGVAEKRARVKEETQQLKESSMCKICLEDPANIVFLPCGHLVACAVCTPALERCPVCRIHIRGSVRVHLSDMASLA